MSQDLIKNRDIVIVGQQAWDIQIGSNCKNLAVEFSKYNRVLYVNPPLDRITKIKDKKDPFISKRINVVNKVIRCLTKQFENLWELNPDRTIESVNWIRFRPLFRYLNKRNNIRFASSIKRAMKELDFKNVILFNDNDIFRSFYLKELLSPQVSVYYSRDYMLAVDYWRYHGMQLEPELIEKSDVIVANSIYLANYCKKYNPRSFYVGQGCDLTLFKDDSNLHVPKELEEIKTPIIGYVGAVSTSRLDIDILVHIAREKPEWQVVLVGPADDQFKNSELNVMKNVHFIGHVPESRLPSFIKGFDVCLNPQLLNELTIGNYPRKIDEYLAMGKPVVATLTEAMGTFSEFVYLATSKEEYVRFIGDALSNNSTELIEARKLFASSHTWTNSVAEIYKAINSTV
ncbi:glycosyltransferase [Pedobacter foliorum]|uniref:glycosyltransferase n=1 Tax=Pedobacter foliorum TaxID=2739058 RepID=UPI00156778C7|nr:glycosyltransferase [Pedobacter foliorum]NRF38212.1 glycosyltransferase [Pedobacter foliorum]